jgi:hypothetical protein
MIDGLTGPLNGKQARYMTGIKESTERWRGSSAICSTCR